MNIEHLVFLSWFSWRRESHEQDGERLSLARTSRVQTASGDPAMAIGLPSMPADIGPPL
jgi:hypothetical protein